MNDKILDQIILQTKNLGLSGSITNNEFQCVELSLNIKLPEDFKTLCSYCSYEFFSCFDTLNFGDYENGGVIKETLYYRKHDKLTDNYLILSYDDSYFLLLNIISKEKSEVIWCDAADFFNLCAGKPMEYNPTIFPSFTDFFEYLIDEEEKMQAEDALLQKANN